MAEVAQRSTCAWTHLDAGEVAAGDRVSAEAGGLPVYRVLSIENGRLWMRDEGSGRDHIAPMSAMVWKLAG